MASESLALSAEPVKGTQKIFYQSNIFAALVVGQIVLPKLTGGRGERLSGITIEHVIITRTEEQPTMFETVFVGNISAISSCYISAHSVPH